MVSSSEEIQSQVLDSCLTREILGQEGMASRETGLPDDPELRGLLDLARDCRRTLAVALPPEAAAAGREDILKRARNFTGSRKRSGGLFSGKLLRGRILRPLGIAAILVVLLAGAALASSTAGPDSFLYPLKQMLEKARYFSAMDDRSKARVEVSHANVRLDELLEMVDAGKPEYVSQLLADFDGRIGSAQTLAERAAAQGSPVEEILALIDSAQARRLTVLNEIIDKLPAEIRDAIARQEDGVMPGPVPEAPASQAPENSIPAGAGNIGAPAPVAPPAAVPDAPRAPTPGASQASPPAGQSPPAGPPGQAGDPGNAQPQALPSSPDKPRQHSSGPAEPPVNGVPAN
ncbi:MAG: hypothetical protein IBX61_02655 [Thermoleophilia bacterium]|nr:hypothetical protein [Thermoleophilia bacterium]